MKRPLAWIICVFLLSAICGANAEAQDIPNTNAPIEFIPIHTKAPIVMKNLYGNRSKARVRSSDCGPSSTEKAVMRCLRWLKNVQNEDGSWGGVDEPATEATGMALLTFLAHGETPSASGEFGETVERAIRYLLTVQNEDGTFKGKAQFPASEHGIVTRAMCEAYAMTKIPMLSNQCVRAVDVIIKAQRPAGLWGIDFSQDTGPDDVESSVWQILALKSARMSGLKQEELRLAMQKARTAITLTIELSIPEKKPGPSIYCLQITGYPRDKMARLGLTALEGLTTNWRTPNYDNPVYQWHFITLAKFNEGAKQWVEWNRSFSPALVTNQIVEVAKNGMECGYWVSPGTNERYGKIYSTALCCMMLECYYQYMPFSQHVDRDSPPPRKATGDTLRSSPEYMGGLPPVAPSPARSGGWWSGRDSNPRPPRCEDVTVQSWKHPKKP